MTVTTAKVAGCRHITACSPPRPETGIHPAIIYTADLCGADTILAMGGVQGIAAMAFGLFGLPKADILVGPGNQFVAEAKRILFGRVGIDMFAGPTDSLIIADAPPTRKSSPAISSDRPSTATIRRSGWSPTTARSRMRVMARVPDLIATLPELNAAERDGRLARLCRGHPLRRPRGDGGGRRRVSRPSIFSVQAADLDWWLGRLRLLRLAVPRRGDDGGLRRQGVRAPTTCCRPPARRATPADCRSTST